MCIEVEYTNLQKGKNIQYLGTKQFGTFGDKNQYWYIFMPYFLVLNALFYFFPIIEVRHTFILKLTMNSYNLTNCQVLMKYSQEATLN